MRRRRGDRRETSPARRRRRLRRAASPGVWRRVGPALRSQRRPRHDPRPAGRPARSAATNGRAERG
ncbi:hypothetical protein DEW08_01575 [Azospirillum thermophilum]|uniref:Uncharacterized protein n=1 Tax=Azospirillum thermophilum TaxID=2202148 RepID=A0A2S2CKS6_9PROT|nr:hypothetical protein DEW08_01575 [Azospirillum thermophilum]